MTETQQTVLSLCCGTLVHHLTFPSLEKAEAQLDLLSEMKRKNQVKWLTIQHLRGTCFLNTKDLVALSLSLPTSSS